MPTKPNSVSQKVLGHLEANPDRPISYDELGEIQGVPRQRVPATLTDLDWRDIHIQNDGDKSQVIYNSEPYASLLTQAWVH